MAAKAFAVFGEVAAERRDAAARRGLSRGPAGEENRRPAGQPAWRSSRNCCPSTRSIRACTRWWKAGPASGAGFSTGACSTWNLTYLAAWKRYRRVLSQRNAALKRAASGAELRPWSLAVAEAGGEVDDSRARLFGAACAVRCRVRPSPARSPADARVPARLGSRPAPRGRAGDRRNARPPNRAPPKPGRTAPKSCCVSTSGECRTKLRAANRS